MAGVNDLFQGGIKETLTNSILELKNSIDENNKFHPDVKNEFVVSTIFNPPKLVKFPGTGRAPSGFVNRLNEVIDINQWVIEFNDSYGFLTPRFHRYGVRRGKQFLN